MHLIRISIEGIRQRSSVVLDLGPPDALRKWTVLGTGRQSTSTLVAVAASLAPGRIAHLVAPHLSSRFARCRGKLQTEVLFRREDLDDGSRGIRAGGWQLVGGVWERMGATPWLTAGSGRRPRDRGICRAAPLGNLILGYGRRIKPTRGDSFDFGDTDYPFQRIGSLFNPRVALTDPVAFLGRMNGKAHRCGTPRQKAFLVRLCSALATMIEEDKTNAQHRGRPSDLLPSHFTKRGFPYDRAWCFLKAWERKVVTLVADAGRHAFDAFPRCESPFDQPGVLLVDRPDLYYPPHRLERFFKAFDELFPRLQFILTLGESAGERFPKSLAAKRLGPPPVRSVRSSPYKTVRIRPKAVRIPRGGTLLVQVDGTLPNFALMQLSRHLKQQGHRVGLRPGSHPVEERAATVYASCIFTAPSSMRHLERLRKHYGERLVVGGSGVDLSRRLDPEVEALPPDYSIYEGLGDRAIGFLTRGCPRRCAFCVVPRKEGSVRQVADLDVLLQGRRKKLILLDDNLLAHPKATKLLEDMVKRGLSVNFNQTLDLCRLNEEQAKLLHRLRCSSLAFHRRVYHFSLNDARHFDSLRRHYDLLQVTSEDNAEFVCMYGFNTSLAEDLERLRFLRSLPRAYVFMQRYQPVPGGPPPNLSRLFDELVEQLLDELVRVVFPQNMKNVEGYYRWLCLEYARQRGRIHLGLVDTLFRYNHRHRRGAFLQKLRDIARLACDG